MPTPSPWNVNSCQVCGSADLEAVDSKFARHDLYGRQHFRCRNCGESVKVQRYKVQTSEVWPEVPYLVNLSDRVIAFAQPKPDGCLGVYILPFVQRGMTALEVTFMGFKLAHPGYKWPERAGRLVIEAAE